jgi:ABC-type multidrug transport system fused ATPase/permease subunit
LNADLRQFAKEDFTLIGEKGVTLSGGQKARLSLARALYSRSDIYLLDDPLAAVDSKVARIMFDNAIRGELMKDKIVVLVTHHLNFAREGERTLVF